MGEAEIKEAIGSVLKQLGLDKPAISDKGKIMKSLMPLVKGKAEGGLVISL